MKKLALIVTLFVLSIAPSLAQEPDQKPDKEIVLKKWDYLPEHDLIIFGDNVNLHLSEETIRYKSTEGIEIVIDETKKSAIVQGFGAYTPPRKYVDYYKTIRIIVPTPDERDRINVLLEKFRARRADYIAARNDGTIKLTELLPVQWVDFSAARDMVIFGILQDGDTSGTRQCLRNHVAVKVRDDGFDYTSIEYTDNNTYQNFLLDLSIVILVPVETDVLVWEIELEQWGNESSEAREKMMRFDNAPIRLLPTDRVSIRPENTAEKPNAPVNLGPNNMGQKFELTGLRSPDLLSELVEIHWFWKPQTCFVPVNNITVEEIKPEDIPRDDHTKNAWVAFFDKDEAYPHSHYKKAVIYAKPEVLEKYKAQIEIYRRACEEYKEKISK